jgi:DNA-directed RNA polymerase specialized sigma24 family protein
MRFHQNLNSSTAYTNSGDFCRIFAEEMDSLYLLAYLLTADSDKAEQCFVAGIGDCVEGNAVFKEWARSWARRTVIRNAIRLVNPGQEMTRSRPLEFPAKHLAISRVQLAPELEAILKLNSLERFAFVMLVLEGFSYQDCSILLGCSRQTVVNARQRALQKLGKSSEAALLREEGSLLPSAMLSR